MRLTTKGRFAVTALMDMAITALMVKLQKHDQCKHETAKQDLMRTNEFNDANDANDAKVLSDVSAQIASCGDDGDQSITLKQISERQLISLSYLEQLFVRLRRCAIVKSCRGPGGGYKLAKSPIMITLGEVIRAVEDDLDARECRGKKNCTNNKQCLTHDLWHDLTNHVYDYLDGITLAQLTERYYNAHYIKPIVNTAHKINKIHLIKPSLISINK